MVQQHYFVTVEYSFLECYQKFSTSNYYATHMAEIHITFHKLGIRIFPTPLLFLGILSSKNPQCFLAVAVQHNLCLSEGAILG
jgi:hypothetical protein